MPSFSWNLTAPPVTPPAVVSVAAPSIAEAPFGTDVSTFDDLDRFFRVMGGPRVIAEALLRRLSTPAGGLFYDPDYGYDVRQLLNAPLSTADLARARIAIVAECQKDQRVDSCEAEVALSGSSLRLTLSITTASGPFSLVADVSAVTVSLISFNQGNA